ncbi:MAG: hypothetical protein IJU81_04225, partial [Bacteroidales bacterium]|nr:hypothetical protein [Bacteroidales bacterium]
LKHIRPFIEERGCCNPSPLTPHIANKRLYFNYFKELNIHFNGTVVNCNKKNQNYEKQKQISMQEARWRSQKNCQLGAGSGCFGRQQQILPCDAACSVRGVRTAGCFLCRHCYCEIH